MIANVIRPIRNVWLILGITLFLFALLEGACSFAFFVGDHFTAWNAETIDRRTAADDYARLPWPEDYYKEFKESYVARWEPYVYWRRKPYNGKYITVNADGIRVTPTSEVRPGNTQRPMKVFMFGGSSMWGTGARNTFTIPALLATELGSRGIRADVINFGETGWVSSQGVIMLLRQLQKGDIPDVVVFYDGGNDTYSAYQQGTAGLPQNEFNRAMEFNLTQRRPELRRFVVTDTIRSLATFRLTQASSGWIGLGATRQEYGRGYDIPRIAEGIVGVYLNNLELVKTMAASYKFTYLFYWQPTIFGKARLSHYEKTEYAREEYLEKFFDVTRKVLSEKTLHGRYEGRFHDFSAIFSGVEEPVYVDWLHLSERGNATIARAMAEHIVLNGSR